MIHHKAHPQIQIHQNTSFCQLGTVRRATEPLNTALRGNQWWRLKATQVHRHRSVLQESSLLKRFVKKSAAMRSVGRQVRNLYFSTIHPIFDEEISDSCPKLPLVT
jgi:hypothetical protein